MPTRLQFFLVFVLALFGRLAFAWLQPTASGDWALYGNVAENIARGCGVAVFAPQGCVPHFGGNGLPLFPALAGALWWLFGQPEVAPRIARSIAGAVTTTYLTYAVARFARCRRIALAVGLLQALSPVQAVWAGAMLTEALALASTQWVLAELLLGHAQGRVRILPVGLAMTFAIWVRLDGVLLAVPVALSAFLLERPTRAMRACALAAILAVASLAAWSARNLWVGISPLPIYGVLPDGSPGVPGYVQWVKRWMVTEHERSRALHFGARDFDRIEISEGAYGSRQERAEVQALLARLRNATGEPFPPEIDAAFADLAARRAAQQGRGERLALFGKRALALARPWIWPWARQDAAGRALPPTPSDLYRFAVVLAAGAGAVILLVRRERLLLVPFGLAMAYVITRIGFFAATANIETRYMVELAPFLETVAAFGIAILPSAWGKEAGHGGRRLQN